MKRIIITVINDLSTDQRLDRMTGTLIDEGCDVFVVGRKLPDSMPYMKEGLSFRRFSMPVNNGPLFYLPYNVLLFFFLLFKKKPDLLIPIDLDTLLPNYLISRIKKVPLLYDSHEYYTESPEFVSRPRTQKIWESMEKRILPHVKYAMTVSESIADAYREKYNVKFHVVRNLARKKEPLEYPEFHLEFTSKYKIIYQGALNLGRGLELLISAMEFMDDTQLLIVGDGDLSTSLRALSKQKKLQERIVFLGKLTPDTLHKYTSQCNLGVSVEEDLGLNYRYALPNKLFDYIQARIPVICSELPEMSAVVRKFEIGEVLKIREPEAFARQVKEMLTNGNKALAWNHNLGIASRELCWEMEEEKLKELIERI